MKKRLMIIMLAGILCIGCGSKNASDTTENNQIQEITEEVEETVDSADSEEKSVEETAHIHNYVESVTTEVTCENDGLKTYTCECGDSYTEVVTAMGHVFENYVSNEDATYTADGTETAVCSGCELTDTRIVEGSKQEYTYTDMDKIMYAVQSVNVRDLPMKEGNKLGSLSNAQEIKVTGQCNETSWYRVEYNGAVAYVSNKNLQDTKPIEQTASEKQPTQSEANVAVANITSNTGDEICPYPLYVILYDNQGFPYFYGKYGGSANMDAENLAKTNACMNEMDSYVEKAFPRAEWQHGIDYFNSTSWKSIGRYEGMQVVVRYLAHLHGESLAEPEERGIPTEGNKIFIK